MDRLRRIEAILSEEVEKRPLVEGKDNLMISHIEIAHGNSVAMLCWLLALKRNLDPEIAAVIGYLHDLGRIRHNLLTPDHAWAGAGDVRSILTAVGLFSTEETEVICTAILNHDHKERTDGLYDELVKDADALDRSFHYPDSKRQVFRNKRRDDVLEELGIACTTVPGTEGRL